MPALDRSRPARNAEIPRPGGVDRDQRPPHPGRSHGGLADFAVTRSILAPVVVLAMAAAVGVVFAMLPRRVVAECTRSRPAPVPSGAWR
jgi:hypothetical protein